jgi:hypothetical protein
MLKVGLILAAFLIGFVISIMAIYLIREWFLKNKKKK